MQARERDRRGRALIGLRRDRHLIRIGNKGVSKEIEEGFAAGWRQVPVVREQLRADARPGDLATLGEQGLAEANYLDRLGFTVPQLCGGAGAKRPDTFEEWGCRAYGVRDRRNREFAGSAQIPLQRHAPYLSLMLYLCQP